MVIKVSQKHCNKVIDTFQVDFESPVFDDRSISCNSPNHINPNQNNGKH